MAEIVIVMAVAGSSDDNPGKTSLRFPNAEAIGSRMRRRTMDASRPSNKSPPSLPLSVLFRTVISTQIVTRDLCEASPARTRSVHEIVDDHWVKRGQDGQGSIGPIIKTVFCHNDPSFYTNDLSLPSDDKSVEAEGIEKEK